LDLDEHIIRRNKRVFEEYCRRRRQNAFDLDKEKAAVAFDIVPTLLSINDRNLPGYIPDGDSACGIYGFGTSRKLDDVVRTYFFDTRRRRIPYQRFLIQRPMIESLFLMGSVGTVAQRQRSDFDFWACIDASRVSREAVEKLHEKTESISRFCQSTFNMEAHFFIMDVEDIRDNDFGTVDEESVGSSQRKFLKEEFYRALLLVSGKVPFWWITPPDSDREAYERYFDWWIEEDLNDVDDFVDLGFLEDVPREEFMGTILWHWSKGLKDPFKALIKISMMEWYLSDSYQGQPLCSILKSRVLDGSRSLRELDPYALILETAQDYYRQQQRWDHIELLRKAFYIKANPRITRLRLRTGYGDYQVDVFRELMQEWNWFLDKVEDLNQMANWSYHRHLGLATDIRKFFFSTYQRLRSIFDFTKDKLIDHRDLTLIGRKISGLFTKQDNKLEITPFLTKKRSTLTKCIFKFDQRGSDEGSWLLYDVTPYPYEPHDKGFLIYRANRVAKAAAWLVVNSLYDRHKTHIEMPPNPSGINVNELLDLLNHLQSFFSPAAFEISMGPNLQTDKKLDKLMVIADLVVSNDIAEPKALDFVYSNTWGEMFVETQPFREGLQRVNRYVSGLGVHDIQGLTEQVKVHVPKITNAKDIKKVLGQVIVRGLDI